jgi:adenylate cyclase
VAAATSALVFLVLLAARGGGLLEPGELFLYDRYLRARPACDPIDARVVLVEYTERDIQEQREFPLSDARLAAVLERILAGGPRAVGVDLYRDVPVPPGTQTLSALLARDPRVVMIHRFGGDGLLRVPPPPGLEGGDQIGFSDLKLDNDEEVRRGILYQEDEESGTGLSLALRVALLWLAPTGRTLALDPEDPDTIRVGPTSIPRLDHDAGGYADADAGGYQYLLDFRGAPARFARASVGDVLDGEVAAERFRDRIVLLGVTAETHADFIHTPFGAWPGVEVHGHMASQLVRYGLGESATPRTFAEPTEAAWLALWCVAGGALAVAVRSLAAFVGLALAGLAAVLGTGWAGLAAGLWMPCFAPAAGWLASASLATAWVSRRERAQRALLMQLFARHLNPEVASALWAQRDAFLDGGRPRPQRVTATILFADVRGSTALGEKLEPLVYMEWLNDFMEAMASEVLAHGGIVDDYFGDGLKADFGVPVPRASEGEIASDAVAAVRCALALEAALVRLNARWLERGKPAGAMRVGICTGPAMAGSIGSRDRLKYTVAGDVVNTAARLESLDAGAHDFAARPCRILIAEPTRVRVGDAFDARMLGEFVLRGREEPVRVYEVLGRAVSRPEA